MGQPTVAVVALDRDLAGHPAPDGFTDDQALFAYRSFNSFLLGFLLLETSAVVLRDPKPGDGSYQTGEPGDGTDPVDPTEPVPGALSPCRSRPERRPRPPRRTTRSWATSTAAFPMIHDLRAGLAAAYYDAEFRIGLTTVLDRIARRLDDDARGGTGPGTR